MNIFRHDGNENIDRNFFSSRKRWKRKSKVGFARESQYRFEFMEVDARRLSNYPVPRKKDYVNREGGDRRARARVHRVERNNRTAVYNISGRRHFGAGIINIGLHSEGGGACVWNNRLFA